MLNYLYATNALSWLRGSVVRMRLANFPWSMVDRWPLCGLTLCYGSAS